MKAGDKVSKEQVEDLGTKLEKFAQGLPKEERDVLGWVLERASTATGQLSDEDLKKVAGGVSSLQLAGFRAADLRPDRKDLGLRWRPDFHHRNPGQLVLVTE